MADIHLTYDTANEDYQRALTYAESNCNFTIIDGDLTSTGAESELQLFKSIGDAYSPTKPKYPITGNHENFSTVCHSFLQTYTGYPLYYTVTNEPTNEANRNYYNADVGDDVFIMVGHYGGYGGDGIGWKSDEFLSQEELQWFYETLEKYRNRRCFVHFHVLPHEHGVGNPNGLYKSALIWKVNDGGLGQSVINLLRHYKNTITFHGHSHTMLELQEIDKKANYSSVDDYKSVHIPSLAVPRDLAESGTTLENVYAESEGYIVDVYDDNIVLNGRDFIDNDADGHIIPIATYKIDTPLVEIEPGTFTDSTGTITT